MSRKNKNFGQLINYMQKGKEDNQKDYSFYHNIFNTNNTEKEFKENAKNLKERKNANYFYHEVISITRTKKIDLENQKEILYKIIKDYTQLRAKRNLVYGVLHEDNKDNLHYHLMISANELNEEKRHRLSKDQFNKIQKNIEEYILNKYPELEQKTIYNQSKKQEKTSKKEYEFKKRTGKKSTRDQVKEDLKNVFKKSKNKTDFFNLLNEKGFKIYIRGKTIGVKKEGINYRLKTLGLLKEFNKISNVIEKDQAKDQTNNQIKNKSYNVENKYKKEKINRGFGEVLNNVSDEIKESFKGQKESLNEEKENLTEEEKKEILKQKIILERKTEMKNIRNTEKETKENNETKYNNSYKK
jgi:hypothetical protein